MHTADTSPLSTAPWLTRDAEDLASRSTARLLITGVGSGAPEACARRVHGLSPRRQFPFVLAEAGDLPVDAGLLRAICARLLDDAAGGTIFVNDVDAMPAPVQDVFVELLCELESAREATAAIRLVSGTTVSLIACMAAGTFAERLFYRLNTIHLIPADDHAIDRAGGLRT